MSQNPRLSQVFLDDVRALDPMLSALREAGVRHVLEIGPGSGILTRELARGGWLVTAVERDPRWAGGLRREFGASGVSILEQDFLTFDLSAWLASKPVGSVAVVGNIPYHISSPIVLRLLGQLPTALKIMVLMVQREFAHRIVAQPGGRDYGRLSIFVQLRAEAKVLGEVSRHKFRPVPLVDSSFVGLWPLQESMTPEQMKGIERVAGLAFRHRRKKLSNSLRPWLAGAALSQHDLDRRPEVLSIEEFGRLAKAIEEMTDQASAVGPRETGRL